MQTIEVRGDRGVSVKVPIYPRLQRLIDERGEQQSIIRACEQRLNETAVEARQLDHKISLLTNTDDLFEASSKRERLKQEYQATELRIDGAKATIARLDEEHREWAINFASWQHRRESLIRQLASAVPGEAEYSFALERDVPKSRGQVEAELADVTGKIEAFSQ
jgi:chromosome segregation ATPase